MKINVIGCCGSGKSYFSRELSSILKLPIYYLDVLYWKENWVGRDREDFDSLIKEIFTKDDYIIDGNYLHTLEMRFKEADKIYFLDMPLELCLESETKRRGTKRDDLPSYLEEKYDPEFIEYIKSFEKDQKPIIIELIEKYKSIKDIIIFHSREEKNDYIKKLKNKE